MESDCTCVEGDFSTRYTCPAPWCTLAPFDIVRNDIYDGDTEIIYYARRIMQDEADEQYISDQAELAAMSDIYYSDDDEDREWYCASDYESDNTHIGPWGPYGPYGPLRP